MVSNQYEFELEDERVIQVDKFQENLKCIWMTWENRSYI